MDYIQQDLDLIRTASGDADEEVKKQTVKKKKTVTPKRADIPSKTEKMMASAKNKPKKTKQILPVKVKEDAKVVEKKEKKGRRSLDSPALGKIKLPFNKKQQQMGALEASPSLSRVKKAARTPQSAKSESTIEPQSTVKKECRTASPAPTKGKGGIDPNATPIEAIRFVEGAKIEAVDSGKWYRARIVKVDEDKMDILVHFDGWGARFDTWFPMTSALIRGRTQVDEKPHILKFEEGEDVLGKWSDGNFYPATVLKVAKSGSYNVMFFDGLKKSLRPSHMKKMTEKEKEETMKAAQKLLLLPPEFVNQDSSESGASPSSDGRRYRTSANDREKRLNARSQDPMPVPVRKAKRKADVLSGIDATSQASKDSADDEAISAKKARLDKITTNLISRVSPTLESNESDRKAETIPVEEGTPKSSKANEHISVKEESHDVTVKSDLLEEKVVATASTKKAPVRRGRRPKQAVPKAKPSDSNETPKNCEANDVTKLPSSSNETPEEMEADHIGEIKQGDTHTTTMSISSKSANNEETVTSDVDPEYSESPSSEKPSFEVSDIVYDESPTGIRTYKPGDIVLAKWADCRSYLAYIIKKETDDSYKIRYYDGHVKVVKASFIHPWIGPLPDTLKIFKPKPPQSKLQRSKSIDLKKGRGRPVTKTTGIGRGLPVSTHTRRRTIASVSDAKRDSPVARRRRRRLNGGGFGKQYSPNEKVLAKWTDLRWYPATVVKKMDTEHYQVMYADNMAKLVRDTWLSPWTPPRPDDSSLQDSSTVETSIKADLKDSPKDEESVDRAGKVSIQFLPGRTVLARHTDGISYPATVKEKLDGGKYLVEFDNGVVHKVKFSAMTPWSKTALPPLKKQVLRKLYQPTMTETLQKPQIIELLKQEKHEQAKSTSSPNQPTRGYDAHAKPPVLDAPGISHHKFKCKVPGCVKSFRKEEMLRTHHKHYHQQRYKLRDQDGLPVTVKKKTPKDEGARRRVSADYEVTPKTAITATEEYIPIIPKSRGAKPPIEIYQQHHEQSNTLSQSSITSSSSSAEDAKIVDKQPIVKLSETKAQPAETKLPTMSTRKRRLSSDTKEDESKVLVLQQEKLSDLPENDTDEDIDDKSDPINEDVIRCTCNVDEEEGLMIQCETCLTWQHTACIGVQKTDIKKEKHRDERTGKFKTAGKHEIVADGDGKLQASSDGYICWVCKHPQNVRRNRKYHYNNEFLTKGKLPSLVNSNSAQRDEAVNPRIRDVSLMMEEIVKMQESIVGIKNMIKIVSAPNHPLLKTWHEPVKTKTATRSASGNEAVNSPSNQDQPSNMIPPVKNKSGQRKAQSSPSQNGNTYSKTDILRQKENLLDHVTELEAQLDSRITKLIDYISKLNANLGDEDTSDSLQEDLTTVQRLLKNR